MRIFSMIARLISRLSCSELGKNNDYKYMLYDLQGGFQNLNSFLLIVYIFLLLYIFYLV